MGIMQQFVVSGLLFVVAPRFEYCLLMQPLVLFAIITYRTMM
jgi:hypothetical protein